MEFERLVGFVNGILVRNKIPHAYVGALAVGAFGRPRATKDADILLFISPKDVPGLLDLIESEGLPVSRRASVEKKLAEGKPAKVIWDEELSFDFRVAGYSVDLAAEKRVGKIGTAFGDMTLVSPEDLIVYKIGRFNQLDKDDVRSVIRKQKGLLDLKYVEKMTILTAKEAGIPQMVNRFAEVKSWARKFR